MSYRNFGECDEAHDGTNDRDANARGCSLSLPFFKQVQAQSGLFSHVAAYTTVGQVDMSGNGAARMVKGEFVTGDYFQTLGVRAHLAGSSTRATTSECSGGRGAGSSFWQTEFGGSESAIGKTIRLNGVPFQIIGVTEPRFDALTLSNKYDVIVPMAQRPWWFLIGSPEMIGRTTGGWS